MDPRTWDDETLEEGLRLAPNAKELWAEAGRRAEIKLERGELGQMHDASWYDSRQTEAQWLEEVQP